MEENKSHNIDFIDGQMVDLENMSTEQLKAMKEKLKKKEAELLNKINQELDSNEELDK